MKSIQKTIIASSLGLVLAAAILCGGVGILTNFISTKSLLERELETTASLTAQRVSYELTSYKNVVEALGMMPQLSDNEVTTDEKQEIVDRWATEYGMVRGNLLNTAGTSLFDGNNYSDREYFQKAMEGRPGSPPPPSAKLPVSCPLWWRPLSGRTV